jgi:protein SCO1/2
MSQRVACLHRADAILMQPMSAAPSPSETSPPVRPRGLRILLPIAVILVILGGATALLVGGTSKPALPGQASAAKLASYQGLVLSPLVPAPPLSTIHNYDGAPFNLADERGKAVFVTFLYAHCPDVCPLIAAKLHSAYANMAPAMRGRVAIVVVSVDPHGDSAGAVAAFVRQHELTGEARYLIGSASQLGAVWEDWKVGSQKDTSNPSLVNHSALVYGVSASSKLTTIYPANLEPSQIVHDVPGLLAG